MDATRTVAVIVIAWAISASPLVTLPISLVLAIFVLSSHAGYDLTAVYGAAGVVLGRITMALLARASRGPGSAAGRAGLRGFAQRLRHEPRYRQLTFMAGMVPPLGEILYPALGSVRAPLRYALAGTFIAEWVILGVLAWFFAGVGRLFSAAGGGHTHDHNAAILLGVLAIVWIVLGWLRRIDWDHWRTEHRLRVREQSTRGMHGFMRMGGSGGGPTGFGTGFPGGGFGDRPEDAAPDEPRELDADDEIIEGEIVDEDDDSNAR